MCAFIYRGNRCGATSIRPRAARSAILCNLGLRPAIRGLYEQILLATNAGKRELVFNLEGLRSLFGLVGASMQTFGNIKLKHLVPAVEKINKFAGVGVVYKPIKEGRKITGVKIYWTLEKVKIPATEAQIKLAHELYAELTLMNAKNVEALKLQDIERCTKNDAQTIIDTAIKAKKELVKKALEKDKEAKQLEEAIKAKDENDFERLHTIVWLFKLYNINDYIALFCIVAIYSD